MTDRGMVIAFEGLDGAGKSSQVERLVAALTERGHDVQVFRLTANTPFKQLCVRLNEHDLLDATTAAVMKAAELSARMEYAVKPLVERGCIVVWDKYVAGSLAMDAARGVSERHLSAIRASLPEPDLTVFLRAAPDDVLRRKRLMGGPRMMESGLDQRLGLSVRDAFARWSSGQLPQDAIDGHFIAFQAEIALAYPRFLPERTATIDAAQSIEQVSDQVNKALFASVVR
jgi:dTMP kinase